MLVKALANYFGAKLLIFDSHFLLGVRLSFLVGVIFGIHPCIPLSSMCHLSILFTKNPDYESSFVVCWQGLSSKEAELLKDGFNAEKSCSSTKQSPTATDMARSMDPSAIEIDTPSSSNAPTPLGLESQAKLETDCVPSTSGTAKNGLFKLGMCSFVFIPSLRSLNFITKY